jgi:hypothetical protein
VPDWLSRSFAGLPNFTFFPMVYQGFSDFSDKSDGILVALFSVSIRREANRFILSCSICSTIAFEIIASSPSHRHRVGFERPMPHCGIKLGRGPHPEARQMRPFHANASEPELSQRVGGTAIEDFALLQWREMDAAGFLVKSQVPSARDHVTRYKSPKRYDDRAGWNKVGHSSATMKSPLIPRQSWRTMTSKCASAEVPVVALHPLHGHEACRPARAALANRESRRLCRD